MAREQPVPVTVKAVVFVDVDGPMRPQRAWCLPAKGPSRYVFDPCAVATLLETCEEAEAQIVVSSSWRLWGWNKVADLFFQNGISHHVIHEDWRTPNLATANRAEEILDWVRRHPEVERWVALDDDGLDLLPKNFVRVTMADGLLHEHQWELRRKLKGFEDVCRYCHRQLEHCGRLNEKGRCAKCQDRPEWVCERCARTMEFVDALVDGLCPRCTESSGESVTLYHGPGEPQ